MSRIVARILAGCGLVACVACAEAPRGMRLQAPVAGRTQPAPRWLEHERTERDPAAPTTGPLDDLDRSRGLLWRFRTAAPIVGEPQISQEGDVYVATTEGVVHALAADGAFRWSYTVHGSVHQGPSLGPRGRLYVPTSLRRIYALTPKGGRFWVFRSPVGIETSVGVGDRGILYFGGEDHALWALSSRAGALWRGRMPDAISAGPVLDDAGRTVIVASASGRLSRMRGAIHRQDQELPSPVLAPPLVFPGGVLIVQGAAGVVCLGPGGQERWSSPEPRWLGRSEDAPLVAVTRDLQLVHLDLDGNTTHLGPVPVPPTVAPVALGKVHALAAADGQLWLRDAEGQWRSVPVTHGPLSALVADGRRARVLVASGEGTVAAIEVGG